MNPEDIKNLYESLLVVAASTQKRSVEENKDLMPLKQSTEQRKRDTGITSLLSEYINAYKERNKSNRFVRWLLIWFSLAFVSVFAIGSIFCLVWYVFTESKDWEGLAATISAFLTCAGLLIGVLKIITQYAFPVDSEKNITEIVKAIQTNDLTNRYYDLLADGEICDPEMKAKPVDKDNKT